jgi:hypothetical protein
MAETFLLQEEQKEGKDLLFLTSAETRSKVGDKGW